MLCCFGLNELGLLGVFLPRLLPECVDLLLLFGELDLGSGSGPGPGPGSGSGGSEDRGENDGGIGAGKAREARVGQGCYTVRLGLG